MRKKFLTLLQDSSCTMHFCHVTQSRCIKRNMMIKQHITWKWRIIVHIKPRVSLGLPSTMSSARIFTSLIFLYRRKSKAICTFCSMWKRIRPLSRGWKSQSGISDQSLKGHITIFIDMSSTHKVLAGKHLQQGDEVVPVPQVFEQVADMSARLKHDISP